jgi:predicted O-methyltransferase YrrM
MSPYIFESHAEEREFHRLQLIEAANDPTTMTLLQHTGIQPGWSCLELGAGAGSILGWLGDRVGPNGTVWGIDKRTTYLSEFSGSPYEIREGDFLKVLIDSTFDLFHARYVFIHNQQDEAMLHKVTNVLKPGGVAVFEELDFTSALLLNHQPDDSHTRVNRAICKMFVDFGLDPAYALRLPQKLEQCGFHIIETQSRMHLCEGHSPIAKVMAESARALQKEYCATGECTEADISTYITNAHTSCYWALYHSTISVTVQLPVQA